MRNVTKPEAGASQYTTIVAILGVMFVVVEFGMSYVNQGIWNSVPVIICPAFLAGLIYALYRTAKRYDFGIIRFWTRVTRRHIGHH